MTEETSAVPVPEKKIPKTLVLMLRVKGAVANWQISAHMQHMQHKLAQILPVDKLILIPVIDGSTALYWLEGDQDPASLKTLEEVKGKIRPVLQVALKECLQIKPAKLAAPKGAVKELQDGMNRLKRMSN
ncbi:MAG: hypothetical protein Q8K86_05750 [Candidatus Nanopelagicaceae bacterium]|nr:hypothetical protein [Candidatus Nanopelagicaceae bacterium]